MHLWPTINITDADWPWFAVIEPLMPIKVSALRLLRLVFTSFINFLSAPLWTQTKDRRIISKEQNALDPNASDQMFSQFVFRALTRQRQLKHIDWMVEWLASLFCLPLCDVYLIRKNRLLTGYFFSHKCGTFMHFSRQLVDIAVASASRAQEQPNTSWDNRSVRVGFMWSARSDRPCSLFCSGSDILTNL